MAKEEERNGRREAAGKKSRTCSCATLNPRRTILAAVAVVARDTSPLSIKNAPPAGGYKNRKGCSACVLYSVYVCKCDLNSVNQRRSVGRSVGRSLGWLVGWLVTSRRRLRHTTSNYSFRELPNLVTSRIWQRYSTSATTRDYIFLSSSPSAVAAAAADCDIQF